MQPSIRFRARLNGQAGHSIPELMTAVGFLAILAATGQSSIGTMVRTLGLNSAVREVYGEVQKARADAIMRNTRCRVALDSQGRLAVYRFDQDDSSWAAEPSQLATFEDALAVSLATTGEIVFAPNGTAASAASIVVQNADGRSKTVVVGAAGTIRIL